MFGYINPAKEQLGEVDYKVFCSYYCGLCKQLGKSCSQMSRLGLSYDITFLFIVLSSVIDSPYDEKEERCIAHPIKRISYTKDTKVGDYCAKMAGLLSYEKCLDDWNDEKSLKAFFGIIMYRKAYKRAYKVYNQVSVFIKNQLKELSEIEKNNVFDIDMAADKFAKVLSRLFTPDFIDDKDTKRQLEWFGYNVGRWIYIMDAIADIRDDYKKGRYNPTDFNSCSRPDHLLRPPCQKGRRHRCKGDSRRRYLRHIFPCRRQDHNSRKGRSYQRRRHRGRYRAHGVIHLQEPDLRGARKDLLKGRQHRLSA